MPGKVNPVMSEALMMVAARVAGNHTAITIAGGRGNFELNVMLPVIAHSMLESITLLAGASRAFADRCVAGIEANEQRARELLDRNPAIATALNPYIGYDAAARVPRRLPGRESGARSRHEVTRRRCVRGMTEPGLRGRVRGLRLGEDTGSTPDPGTLAHQPTKREVIAVTCVPFLCITFMETQSTRLYALSCRASYLSSPRTNESRDWGTTCMLFAVSICRRLLQPVVAGAVLQRRGTRPGLRQSLRWR